MTAARNSLTTEALGGSSWHVHLQVSRDSERFSEDSLPVHMPGSTSGTCGIERAEDRLINERPAGRGIGNMPDRQYHALVSECF